MSKFVHIMRGPSGCGKGTFIKHNFPEAFVVSADQYFMQPSLEGHVYEFDPSKLAIAHNDCFGRFLDALLSGAQTIVVDNTNTHIWEFENYIKAANMMGYSVRVTAMRAITVEDIKVCAERNLHGTPIEVVAKMAYEFEKHPYDHVREIE